MEKRTKTGFILVGIGLIISAPLIVFAWFDAVYLFTNYLWLMIPMGIGFFILAIGMMMLKTQLRKAVYGDDRFSRF
jgi:hypothetical protein